MKKITLLYNSKEKEIFSSVKKNALEDLKTWNIANIAFPFSTIIITIILFFFSSRFSGFTNYSLSEIKCLLKELFNLILNGSIPLIGLNLFVASGYFLLRFDKKKEKDFGLDIYNTRVKMLILAFVFYLFLSILFAVQTIFNPFDGVLKILAITVLTIVGIISSFKISNKFFLLQENYIEKSFAENITDGVRNIKDGL